MSDIQSKTTRHAKKQENTTLNPEKTWINRNRPRNYKNDECANKNIKTAILSVLSMYEKVKENENMMRR